MPKKKEQKKGEKEIMKKQGDVEANSHRLFRETNAQSGITLVALVITIIVLGILVGVTVSVGINSGLIGNANQAVTEYEKAQKQEAEGIDVVAKTAELYTMEEVQAGGYTGDSHKKYVETNQSTGETKTAYIPAGFTVSDIEGEKSIDTGLVIYSGEVTDWSTAQTTHN